MYNIRCFTLYIKIINYYQNKYNIKMYLALYRRNKSKPIKPKEVLGEYFWVAK